MAETARSPNLSQHITIAGMTGSGKTTGALDMLSRRLQIPWLIVDHKKDDTIAKLPREKMKLNPLWLPDKPGLYHVTPDMGGSQRQELEELLGRIFRHRGSKPAHFGVYIDEGHLMGVSPMVRNIMVAGRSRRVPMMWVSQRAHHIDTFIWSQATFYRAFALQNSADIKRFNENFPERYQEPDEFHSHYFDGTKRKQFYLGPAAPISETIKRVDAALS